MSKYIVKGKSEKGDTWAHFVVNKAIGPEMFKHYKNIDEASGAPMAQQLFYLPFVKSVRIGASELQIERFNILEWEEVITEVCEQIENYLNEGGIVIHQKNNEKVPVSIYAESTPNPSVMKFVANKPLVSQTMEFKNIDEAKEAPLAQKLFHFPFVKEVFMDANYLSITKFEIANWEDVVMEVRTFIREYIEAGNSIVNAPAIVEKQNALEDEKPQLLNETEQEIVNILDEYIKPAVASDGGNIAFEAYDQENKTVKVILQGACSGCPSSTFTLKNGIETMLKDMMPGRINHVEAING